MYIANHVKMSKNIFLVIDHSHCLLVLKRVPYVYTFARTRHCDFETDLTCTIENIKRRRRKKKEGRVGRRRRGKRRPIQHFQ